MYMRRRHQAFCCRWRRGSAVARSENALTQIRRYEPSWQPREQSFEAPGSINGAISAAEARAVYAESYLTRLRTGNGRNYGPPLDPLPQTGASPRAFDGGAWIDIYRTINNAPNLFGEPIWPQDKDTVAVGMADDQLFVGVNRWAPGYTAADLARAIDARNDLIQKYPDVMATGNIGAIPNNSLFHAEPNLLIRAAYRFGSLENRTIEMEVDREICYSCCQVLPKLGLELGNPYVVIVERGTGTRSEMWNGQWLRWRRK
jgi:hypothetical protein